MVEKKPSAKNTEKSTPPQPVRKPEPKVQPLPSAPAVVGGTDVDEVSLSRLVYKNVHAKKSLSVHHLQRRLEERGYAVAASDKDGWYGDYTARAVEEFARDYELPPLLTFELLELIFLGDDNVRVVR